ncbi:hypothetical protein PtrV1_12384 [Pyrenophora tritici-repentis]|nr:hypothetical protein PtrV1_12384 [Pyrenophora tritici-repentis]KAI0577151.1 hypothetical protein Alg215_07070 [Pyrenophora tritici-repentis]
MTVRVHASARAAFLHQFRQVMLLVTAWDFYSLVDAGVSSIYVLGTWHCARWSL